MRIRLALGLLLGVLTATAVVDAQLGGLIRRKVEESVKPKPEPTKPEPPKPGAASAAPPLGCSVDGDAMDRLLKGLEAERAAREAALKEAAGTSEAQYSACTGKLATSPEAQKIFGELTSLPENATPAQSQAASDKMAKAMTALLEQQCGPTPAESRDRLNKKFDDAGKVGRETSGLSDCYARLQEHAVRFCELPSAQQTSAQNGGLKVPGTGTGVFWIYTEAEAKAYAPRCGQLQSLMAAIDKQSQQQTQRK